MPKFESDIRKSDVCFICGNVGKPYFIKAFNSFGLSEVEYYKCHNCGFVFSKTHREMDDSDWRRLNSSFHEHIVDLQAVKSGKRRPPPYFEQAAMLNVLKKNNIVNPEGGLDWGGGYGVLAKNASKYYGININSFDKYMGPEVSDLTEDEIQGKKFKVVINSAVVEHIPERAGLEEVNSLVSSEGCLILHTVVVEDVPRDPDWFYLLPVHTSFYTNKSMGMLMEQWGYQSSLYCPSSKMWVMFKQTPEGIEKKVNSINLEFLSEYFFFKKGFMDYWK